MTPNFQRQHYLYWCNVYNLSHGCQKALPDTTIRVLYKGSEKMYSGYILKRFFCFFSSLHEHHHYNLSDNHAAEHCRRIDCCIAYGGIVAGQCVVGIIKSHRIGHAAAQHSTCAAKVELADTHGKQCHNDYGDEGDDEAF